MARPDPLDGFAAPPAAVVAAVNDPADTLLMSAVSRGIPYVDITRWTERVHAATAGLDGATPISPVILASGWMGGVAPSVAAAAARRLARVETVAIDVLYALKDKAGPDSFEYMDRLATPFTIIRGGRPTTVKPMSDPRTVLFSGGRSVPTYRFDTPDHLTLPVALGAGEVSARIAHDDAGAMAFMRLLLRSGFWRLISGPSFTGLRKALAFNPGPGAPHEVRIELTGQGADGADVRIVVTILDALGQTHMTAAGAAMQVERLLGLDGRSPPPAGLGYPDQAADPDAGVAALRRLGVTISLD